MALLDDVSQYVKSKQDAVFNIADKWDKVLDAFSNIAFLGEIEKDVVYFTMLHQIKNDDGDIIDLDITKANNFYLSGSIQYGYKPYAWTFWKINTTTEYITVFTSFHGNANSSPKENYSLAYEQIKTYEKYQLVFEAEIRKLRPEDREVFKKVLDIIEFSKTSKIEIGNFDRKVFTNFNKYFGIRDSSNIVDDEPQQTQPPETISLPQPYNSKNIEALFNGDIADLIISGPSFDHIKFDEENAYTVVFDVKSTMFDVMYSIISYINTKTTQRIPTFNKIYKSNIWPISTTEDEQKANSKALTKYELAITKCKKLIYFEVRVQEIGTSYVLTNVNLS